MEADAPRRNGRNAQRGILYPCLVERGHTGLGDDDHTVDRRGEPAAATAIGPLLAVAKHLKELERGGRRRARPQRRPAYIRGPADQS